MIDYIWLSGDFSQAEARVVAWAGPVPALKTWFKTGEDVHLNVAKMIGKVVQEAKLALSQNLFMNKSYKDLVKSDPERQLAKNTVHGNNYGLGKNKFALLTGLPIKHAEMVQNIYHGLFPEIKQGYQRWIETCLRKDRTLTTPLGRRKIFYGIISDDMLRAGYAYYPQSTVGDLLVRLLCDTCEAFSPNDPFHISFDGLYKGLATPEAIRARGFDVRMQLHDNINVIIPNDPDSIRYAYTTIKKLAGVTMIINGDPLVIPMDFKIGKTLAKRDLVDYP